MSRELSLITALVGFVVCGACSDSRPARQSSQPPRSAPTSETAAPTTQGPRIVFLGDSLTAGLGLPAAQSYPALIQARLARAGHQYEVVNAGVSGDTSAGGLRRLEWALDGEVAILVLALGANDGLRGLPPEELRKNLGAAIDRAQARKIDVLLAGMEAPPNNGRQYAAEFRAVYRDLERRPGVTALPFLLDKVAGDPALNQDDGIHPNAKGAQVLADAVYEKLEPMLKPPTGKSP